jgi:2-dehydro-3-deoxyphosphooctonate aldolase (KDO 8-P synthase)
VRAVAVGGLSIGTGHPLAFIAGPCVVESTDHALHVAGVLAEVAARRRIPLIFKASYDKANRTSNASFRGPGVERGLAALAAVKARTGLPVLTDVHEPGQVNEAASVVDVLQIPAFLCRQTDLIVAAARTGKPVNIKKGQFLAPRDMRHVAAKVTAEGNSQVLLTERGVCFGYNNLVVDMRAIPMMQELGFPVVFDVTHSLQLPGAGDGVTAGLAEYIDPLACAGVAAGADAVFMEVHEEPARAKSDAANALRLSDFEPLVARLLEVHAAVRQPRVTAPSPATAPRA